MAQHKDIDRVSALLGNSGGWHLEYHPESEIDFHKKYKKRNRKRCIYYSDGMCNYKIDLCKGVSCGSYYENNFLN